MLDRGYNLEMPVRFVLLSSWDLRMVRDFLDLEASLAFLG